ncbi:hypothetical protein POM88_032808 [Heracleum sosnowskyi]|uniref:Reverse transcriptase domain-containing protein n=1 Tax=Heracleum sosnowskyi TaxID=360622 RepID=A0AAD8I2Y4_9APIA|nr:hypothetical protein POM88_032808 [Heracleum sosnowskyi]
MQRRNSVILTKTRIVATSNATISGPTRNETYGGLGWIRSIRLVLRNYIYVNGPSSFVDVLMRPYEAQSLNDYRGMANMFELPTYLRTSTVIDTKWEAPSMRNIPVINEFEDVFPEDLLGLPPDREIESGIELAPRTVPVSKAPYRLAPVEMKKLVAQL